MTVGTLPLTELKEQGEAAEKAAISRVKEVPSQNAPSAKLGGLSEVEKKRLVAQYDCESDGDSEYPNSVNSHYVIVVEPASNLPIAKHLF